MNATYNVWLVALSIVIAILASYTALDLASRVAAKRLANSMRDQACQRRQGEMVGAPFRAHHLCRSLWCVPHEHNARREWSRLDQAQVETHPLSKQLLAAAQHDGIDQQAIFVHQIVLC